MGKVPTTGPTGPAIRSRTNTLRFPAEYLHRLPAAARRHIERCGKLEHGVWVVNAIELPCLQSLCSAHASWLRRHGLTGMGDVVHLAAVLTGFDWLFRRLKRHTGWDCHCHSRRARWNARWPLR